MVTRACGHPAPSYHGRGATMAAMKLRTAVLIGFAVGYVLGAKAGRERYEQIRKIAGGIASNPPIAQLIDEVKDLSDTGSAVARSKIGEQLREASHLIRERMDQGGPRPI